MDIKNKGSAKVTKLIKMFGEVEAEKTLNSLKKQAGDVNSFDELIIEIASPGGSVSEGLEIMTWLDGLSGSGKTIITVVTANAYSIASLIMLAANIKLISKHGKVMVHNPMVPELKYVNANDLEKHVEELRELETAMYSLYEVFTGLDTNQIKQLMDNETYLLPHEAVKLGFADMVVDIKPKSFEMTTNKKKEINMSKTINTLNRVMSVLKGDDFVNQSYGVKGGDEIEIFQNDPSTYKKGDRTNIEEGTVTLLDGSIVTIKDFVIDEIDRTVEPAEEAIIEGEEAAPEEVVQADAPEVTTEEVVAPITEDAVEAVIEEPATEAPAKVIEKTESTITTKEVQNTTKEDAEAKVEDAEATTNVGDAPVEAKDVAEAIDMEAKFAALEAKNKELEAKLGEVLNKLDADAKDVEAKLDEVNKFQAVATKTIETVANNMQSGFSPEARAVVQEQVTGTIFQKARAKAGLV